MGRKIDLTGQRFGRWTVVSQADSKNGDTVWNCVCECDKKKVVVGYTLTKGKSLSCGCLRKELASDRVSIHGYCGTPEYVVWLHIIARCENENSKDFHNYGGRGIKMCEEWRSSFETFLADMGERPSPEHSIDRIDVNGNYEPLNCRWATQEVQSRNKRVYKTNKTGVCGVYFNGKLNKYQSQIPVKGKNKHLGCFDTIEEAEEARKNAKQYYWNEPLIN